MTTQPIADADLNLICPSCTGTNTHLEQVFVSAKDEDGPANEIVVNAISGHVSTGGRGVAPSGTAVGTARRHRVALAGYCEDCDKPLALVFTQHKGATLVEWSNEATWVDEGFEEPPF